jgi:putative hemolysin
MEILLLMVLILLNGVFAMSEIALVAARRARLAGLAEAGDKAAAAAIRLGEEPTRFLSTLQIGITSISILNGIVGEAVLAAPLALWLISLGLDVEWSGIAATALVVLVITYVSIVIGELVPKRIGQLHPEGIARLVARPMQVLSQLARPFVHLLSISTDTLLRLLAIRSDRAPAVTEEEIHALLKEGSDAGVIEHHEHQMVRNLFRLDERLLGSLMIPRADIDYLDISKPLEDNLKHISESEHSRFPVCRGGLDEVLGVMPAKQILIQLLKNGAVNLESKLQSQVFVPDSLTGSELLAHFRATGTQMVLVVDEYGEVEGLVTLQDVLEAVTGEFRPRTQDQAWAVQREDGSWLLDGLIPIPEFKDTLHIKRVPEEERRHYHTLNGMMMQLLDRLPATGDAAEWENWRLEVVDMDGKRIDKVMASRLEIPETIFPSED